MAAFFNKPDHTAHSYGPNSTQGRFTYIRIREFIEAVLLRSILLLLMVIIHWLVFLFVMLISCLEYCVI